LTLRLFFFDGTLDFFLFLAATNLRFFRAIQKSPAARWISCTA
jgi:hypothetical protein